MKSKGVVIGAILLAALVVVFVVAQRNPIGGLFLILGLVLAAPIAIAWLRGALDPLESINFFLPLYAYVYLVKPLARIRAGQPFWFGEENLDIAIGVAILGILVFYLGYYTRLGTDLARRLPVLRGEVSSPRLRRCAWTFILIGAFGLWYYMQISGGWREFWSKPHGYGGRPELSTAYITQLPELMVVGFFLILYDTLAERRVNLSRLSRIAIASLGGVGIYAILWSRRTLIAWTLITAFILIPLKRGRRPGLVPITLFALGLYLAITLALAYRPYLHLGVEEEEMVVDMAATSSKTLSQAGDEFDSFLAVVSLYPRYIDYDYFLIYRRIPLHPIPKLLWPAKPPLFVSSWDDFLYQSGITVGSSESLLGDLYIQLGTLGVILGMLTLGVFWKALYAYLQRSPSNGLAQLVYAVTIGNVPSIVMQSTISAFWKWIPFMVPGIIAAYWFASRRPTTTSLRTPVGYAG